MRGLGFASEQGGIGNKSYNRYSEPRKSPIMTPFLPLTPLASTYDFRNKEYKSTGVGNLSLSLQLISKVDTEEKSSLSSMATTRVSAQRTCLVFNENGFDEFNKSFTTVIWLIRLMLTYQYSPPTVSTAKYSVDESHWNNVDTDYEIVQLLSSN